MILPDFLEAEKLDATRYRVRLKPELTVTDAARLLHCSADTVRLLCVEGALAWRWMTHRRRKILVNSDSVTAYRASLKDL